MCSVGFTTWGILYFSWPILPAYTYSGSQEVARYASIGGISVSSDGSSSRLEAVKDYRFKLKHIKLNHCYDHDGYDSFQLFRRDSSRLSGQRCCHPQPWRAYRLFDPSNRPYHLPVDEAAEGSGVIKDLIRERSAEDGDKQHRYELIGVASYSSADDDDGVVVYTRMLMVIDWIAYKIGSGSRVCKGALQNPFFGPK